jgi:hypothetical protein
MRSKPRSTNAPPQNAAAIRAPTIFALNSLVKTVGLSTLRAAVI